MKSFTKFVEEPQVDETTIDGVKVKKLKPSGVTKDVQTALKKSNKGGVVRQAHRQKVGVKEETGIDEGSWKDTNDKDSNKDFVGGRKKGKVYRSGTAKVPMDTTKSGARVPSSWKKMSPAELKSRLKKDRGIKEDAPGSKVGVSTSINQTGGSDPYDIQNDDVLKRVNAFVGSIADREYLIPENAVNQLQGFLERIGLCFEMPDELPESGTITLPLLRYGGVFGKSVTTPFDEFDREAGIDKSLSITVESLRNNSWKVYAKIV